MKLLIVEDEEYIADFMMIGLEKAGYECEIAYDGKAAADVLEEKRYDLILLDIMLPEVNGFELMEYIREYHTPVIFITARSRLEDKVKGRTDCESGMCAETLSQGTGEAFVSGSGNRCGIPGGQKKW